MLGPLLAAMSKVAVTKGTNNGAYHFFQCSEALAQYRLRNYTEAANWAQESAKNPFPYSQAEAYAVMAMVQQKLGKDTETTQELTNCNRIPEIGLPKPGQDLGEDWRDWIIAHVLHSGAKRMIGGEPSSVANLPKTSR
jgi:hypothetical protein